LSRSERPVGPELPLRGSGEFQGYAWKFHGSIKPDGAYTYASFWDLVEQTGGYGGGGAGALPFQAVGEKELRHIGMTGALHSGEGLRAPGKRAMPGAIDGVVSKDVDKVLIHMSDGTTADALLFETGDPSTRFFFLPYGSGLKSTSIVALGIDGNELDRFERRDER